MEIRDQRARFRRSLLRWGSSNRREFLWRELDASPEVVLLSEMLLRKTKAEAVEPVVREMIDLHPDIGALAYADEEGLANTLRPVGLNRIRAKAVKGVAAQLIEKHGGKVPGDLDALLSLPHVGRYSANAVMCFVFGEPRPIVDSNVVRVFARVFGTRKPTEVHKANDLWDFAEGLVPKDTPRDYNYALLDFGAIICRPRRPHCSRCPLSGMCMAYSNGDVKPSTEEKVSNQI